MSDAIRKRPVPLKEKLRLQRADRERPFTAERAEGLRKQIQRRIATWPESRARAKSERKEALALADELLTMLEVYEREGYDNLISQHVRWDLVSMIKRRLKLEEPCPVS